MRGEGWCGFGRGWWCSNPSGSRPNFFGRQHLTFDKGRAWMPEVERPKTLQGCKANRAFIKGHGCPKLNAQKLCKDAKPTERS